jgi:hypothetical protein
MNPRVIPPCRIFNRFKKDEEEKFGISFILPLEEGKNE